MRRVAIFTAGAALVVGSLAIPGMAVATGRTTTPQDTTVSAERAQLDNEITAQGKGHGKGHSKGHGGKGYRNGHGRGHRHGYSHSRFRYGYFGHGYGYGYYGFPGYGYGGYGGTGRAATAGLRRLRRVLAGRLRLQLRLPVWPALRRAVPWVPRRSAGRSEMPGAADPAGSRPVCPADA